MGKYDDIINLSRPESKHPKKKRWWKIHYNN